MQAHEIRTDRLLLRRFQAADTEAYLELAGSRAVADTMISIPHPLPPAFAAAWLSTDTPARFAVCDRVSGCLIGAAELRDIDSEHHQAELSFWVGQPFWGCGYALEACAAVVTFGLDRLALNRIYAFHMARNPASGRVLGKLGMRQEGVLRQRVCKWGQFEDVLVWAVLRDDLLPGGDQQP